VPDEESEDIVIKVAKKRFNYIKTKPLHLSQRIIEECENYAVININVKINKELESLLLSFGSDIEILSPSSFRNSFLKKIEAMNEIYFNDEENLHT
jgi:predicted DNA-binding transcriptional regulator YafY